jgi:hypothetical protein
MPSIESKIYSVLSASSAVVALTTRIYPEVRPAADPLPAVVYSRLSGLRVNSMSGYSGLENARIQFDIYAQSVDMRRQLSDEVILSVTGASAFTGLLVDSPFDSYDDEPTIPEYIRTLDFSIWNKGT